MNIDHLKAIHYRTTFKDECFVADTPEQKALVSLLNRHYNLGYIGRDPIKENADVGDLVVLLFRDNQTGRPDGHYQHNFPHAHVCVVYRGKLQHSGSNGTQHLLVADFNNSPTTRVLSNYREELVRLVKPTDPDYKAIVSLCKQPLVPAPDTILPVPGTTL